MAHLTGKSAYTHLIDRLNKHPQWVTPSELLYKILAVLFSEKEAELTAQLPLKPFTAKQAAGIWKMKLADAQKALDELASRSLLVDFGRGERTIYVLPPPMAGFFEFSMMRVRNDIDQKLLSELFYQYITVEDDFIKALFTQGETQMGRTFVNESALTPELSLQVLDYERASEVVKTARHRGISMCYCRHKKQHLGKNCNAPMDICMTFNTTAASLIKHGNARKVDVKEGLDLLQLAYDSNLVQFGENVRNGVGFICNCCGCCCEAMIAARKFAFLHPVHTTNFLPKVDDEVCSGCGKCVSTCPVEAMTLISANLPDRPKMKKAKLNAEICLGCGLCVKACNKGNIKLIPREKRVITPVNSAHRTVAMAIERGKLQNFIFDNQVLFSHRALSAVFGVILRLPPVKKAMASEQMKSVYLEKLMARNKY